MQEIKVGDLVRIKSIPGLYKHGEWTSEFSKSLYSEDINKHFEVIQVEPGYIKLANMPLGFSPKDLEIVNGNCL